MSPGPSNLQERFEALATALKVTEVTKPSHPTKPQRFNLHSLCVRNKVFAMLSGDTLVVKLPAKRVDELVAAGAGERLDPGNGKPMKEWLSLGPATDEQWVDLATQSLDFVRGR